MDIWESNDLGTFISHLPLDSSSSRAHRKGRRSSSSDSSSDAYGGGGWHGDSRLLRSSALTPRGGNTTSVERANRGMPTRDTRKRKRAVGGNKMGRKRRRASGSTTSVGTMEQREEEGERETSSPVNDATDNGQAGSKKSVSFD